MKNTSLALLLFLVACGTQEQKPMEPQMHTDVSTTVQQTNNTLPDSLLMADTAIVQDTVKKAERPQRLPAQAQFVATKHNYGTIKTGSIIEHTFTFKNIGDLPLEIKDVRGSCGCTLGSYSFLPIRKNEQSTIKARFDSKGKMGNQKSTLTVVTNGTPAEYVLTLEGVVRDSI